VASPAEPESEVGVALRPLETSLAEAVGKIAHKIACDQHWLNKDGPRAEFLRGCELQIGVPLTPRLRSRMLLTYHKMYGSAEKVGEALFNSKSYSHFLRKGSKRPGKKTSQKKGPVQEDDAFVEAMQNVGGVTPSTSQRSKKKKKKNYKSPGHNFAIWNHYSEHCCQPWGQDSYHHAAQYQYSDQDMEYISGWVRQYPCMDSPWFW
jgi:hypothetical protein